MRTMEEGDGKTFPDPYGVIELSYTVHFNQNDEWMPILAARVDVDVFPVVLGQGVCLKY